VPIYEYECPDCGHHFEAMQRMSEDPIRDCPNCGEQHVRRILFAPAIHFKGSGFHNTDYGTRKRGPERSDGDGGASKDGAGAGDKSGGSSSSEGGSGGGDAKSSGKTVGLDKI